MLALSKILSSDLFRWNISCQFQDIPPSYWYACPWHSVYTVCLCVCVCVLCLIEANSVLIFVLCYMSFNPCFYIKHIRDTVQLGTSYWKGLLMWNVDWTSFHSFVMLDLGNEVVQGLFLKTHRHSGATLFTLMT